MDKSTRAEPVSALCQRGEMWHMLPPAALEEALSAWPVDAGLAALKRARHWSAAYPPALTVADFPRLPLDGLVEEAKVRLAGAFPGAEIVTRQEDGLLWVVARVRGMKAKALIRAMDKLDNDWWLDQMERAGGRMQITFEPIL